MEIDLLLAAAGLLLVLQFSLFVATFGLWIMMVNPGAGCTALLYTALTSSLCLVTFWWVVKGTTQVDDLITLKKIAFTAVPAEDEGLTVQEQQR